MVLGDTYSLSSATVCRCVTQVTEGLLELAPRYIKMPSAEALDEVKQRFYEIASKFAVQYIFLCFPSFTVHYHQIALGGVSFGFYREKQV